MATKAQQERAIKWVVQWKDRLLLDSWAVTTFFADEDRAQATGSETKIAAEIIVDSRYNEARMTLYPNLFKRPAAYQESTIVHELLHIVTDASREAMGQAVRKGGLTERKKEDINEALTEHFTKIIFKSYKRNKNLGNYHL
jgi:hypothetical protein